MVQVVQHLFEQSYVIHLRDLYVVLLELMIVVH
jgi:hypothetical protein